MRQRLCCTWPPVPKSSTWLAWLALRAAQKQVLWSRALQAHLVLLDGPAATGARLGVGNDPVHVFALCAVLDGPLAHPIA